MSEESQQENSIFTYVAALVSVVGLAGSLYLSIELDLVACPLCYYQRTFMMACFTVLCVGIVFAETKPGLVATITMPLSIAGFALAAFHLNLVRQGTLECPLGVSRFLNYFGPMPAWSQQTAPAESLIVFGVLTFFLFCDLAAYYRNLLGWVGNVVVGLALAYASVKSASPLPTPVFPHEKELDADGCRKVYRAPGPIPDVPAPERDPEAAPALPTKTGDVPAPPANKTEKK